MRHLLLICAVVALVGCGKKSSREPQTKQEEVNATTTQVTGGSPAPLLPATTAPAPEPINSIAGKQKPLTKEESAKVIEAAIRKAAKKPTGELTKAEDGGKV